jgi:hypothetical protein
VFIDAPASQRLYNAHVHDFLRDQLPPQSLIFFLGQLRPDLVRPLCRGKFDQLNREGVQILLVNRVIYAGGIEYEYHTSNSFAARAALDLSQALAHGTGLPSIPQFAANTGKAEAGASQPSGSGTASQPGASAGTGSNAQQGRSVGRTDAPADPQAATEQIRATLGTQLRTLADGGLSTAGIATSLATGAFGNVALRGTFNRPMAAGVASRISIPIANALVPLGTTEAGGGTAGMTTDADVHQNATTYCRFITHEDPTKLGEQMWRNRCLMRASYLAAQENSRSSPQEIQRRCLEDETTKMPGGPPPNISTRRTPTQG